MSNEAAQAFFNPSDALSLPGWEIQTDNPATSRQRAQSLGREGDEIASKTFDNRTNLTANYTATADNAAIPKAGQIVGGYHIDNITVNFSNTAFVTMTITAHKHGSSNHPTCRTYTGSLTNISSKFGCPSIPIGTSVPTGAGVRSCTYTLSCNHVDELGNQGEYLAAENYDGTETMEVELCDTGNITANDAIPTDATERAARPWTLVTNGHTRGNTQAETSTATVERHIAHDVVNSGT